MHELTYQETNAVSGGNALDTTTGSFVPGDSSSGMTPFQSCLANGAIDQGENDSASVLLKCAMEHIFD